MCKKATRLWSIILVIVMLINMFPMDILAVETLDTGNSGSIPANTQTDNEDVHIIAEVTDKRTEYSKEYLLSNGLHMATVYPQAVHYEENGQWKEINNTLRATGTGAQAAYTNTDGIWDVSFPQQLSTDKGVSITKDGYTLTFYMSGELRAPSGGNISTSTMETGAAAFALTEAEASTAQIQNIDLSDAIAEAEHPETIQKELHSRLQYSDVYTDTNIVYDLTSNQLKESIIMERYSSTLRGYQYTLNTGGLTPVLDESGQIQLFGKDSKEPVMVMPAPYLLDGADAYSGDVTVELVKKGDQYILLYLLPQEWLADEERQWPVILDPVVSASIATSNIKDQCVFSEGWSDPGSTVLDCGYGGYGTGIMRIYLQYVELPKLTSADVIVSAEVKLYKPFDYGHTDPIAVHKVIDKWDSMTMQWSNKAEYDPIAEDFAVCKAVDYYRWDVTDIVRGWYEGENTGMMFKNTDDVETNSTYYHYQRFRSSDYSIYDTVTKPTLSITFRNNNGLESYWDYTSASAGRAGTGYVNNYTGNLVWVRGDMGFGGCVMPVSISHVYNSNDSESNEFSVGNGWRTNFNQLVYQWEHDSNYYVWEDSDGTAHYFLLTTDGTYRDEDGLDLTLTTTGSGEFTYVVTDKYGNTSHFDSLGRLRKQENNQNYDPDKEENGIAALRRTPSSITVKYIDNTPKIQEVIDSAGRIYRFKYFEDTGLLEQISYIIEESGTSTVYYTVKYSYSSDGDLEKIIDNDGKTADYSYLSTGEGAIQNLLNSAVDIDGYVLSYEYRSVVKGRPARVSKVSEKHNNVDGGSLSITYAKNQTTFVDHNGNVQIMQFNNLGNTISVQDDQGRAQYAQYAINDSPEEPQSSPAAETEGSASTGKANQLTKSSKLQNTVINLLNNGSFEGTELWSSISGAATVNYAAGTAYMGNRSLMVKSTAGGTAAGAYSAAFTAEAGQTYTFSAWVKTGAGSAYLALNDGSTNVTSEVLAANQEWTRLHVSYTAETQTTLTARVLTEDAGTIFLDCAQVEKAPTASRYNLIENGDFRFGGFWSTPTTLATLDTTAAPGLSTEVYTTIGVYNSANRLSQDVPVSGGVGDCFVLGGWAKADSVPLGELYGNERQFSLIATFYNGDTQVGDSHVVQFNPYIGAEVNWQSASAPIVAEGDFTKITVELAYDFNLNTVYFDGIQLFKEEFGNSYTYDKNGNVTAVRDVQGSNTVYEYNEDTNDLINVWLNVKKDEETVEGKDIPVREPDMKYTYDFCHNVLTSVSKEGVTTSYEYDQWGNNIKVTVTGKDSPTPIITTSTYSDYGNRLLSTTDAAGNTTTYGYNPATNVLEWVQYPNDTESTRTEYTYDDKTYRVDSVTAAIDEDTTLSVGYTYTDDLLDTITTPTTVYDFNYTEFGLRTDITVGDTKLADYVYAGINDTEGKYEDNPLFALSMLDYGNDGVVEYFYNKQGQLLSQRYENGDTVSYQYDNTGALATVTDSATGRTTTYYYDFTDRLMKYVESGESYSHSVGYTYDDINNLTALVETINGIAHITEYTYDDSYRLTSITNGDANTTFNYDDFSRVDSRVTSHNGTTLLTESFAYRDFPEGSENPTSTSGQVSSLTLDATFYDVTYSYTYDGNGNIVSIQNGSDEANKTTYAYDTAGQLLRENNPEAGKTWVWAYDNAGNITSRKEYSYHTGELDAAKLIETVTYGYNDDNWGDLLTSYGDKSITYDTIGNPLNDGNWVYTWEHGRQLASMTNGTTTIEYQYNADGMRTKKTVTTASNHTHIFQSTIVAPTCTENGHTLHVCSCGYIYQDSPVAATGHTFTTTAVATNCTEVGYTLKECSCGYSYQEGASGHNFTTLVVDPSETVNGFTLHECECGYSYESDPVVSLGGAAVANEDSISDTKVYNYVYNGSSLTQLVITTTTYGESPVVETLYFAYDGSSPMTVTYNGEVFYYVTNLQGDVIAILNSSGTAVVEYTYDAWGNILNADEIANIPLGAANPLTYRGYVYDRETRLYYLQSRYYNPEVGRFINADALVSTGQGILGNNMLAYCHNNPILFLDPSGKIIVFASDATEEQIEQYNRAIEYLKGSTTGKELIEKLEKSSTVFTITFVDDDQTYYEPASKTIYFDTNSGLVIGDGKTVQSAALGLAHEMGHAAQHLDGTFIALNGDLNLIEEMNMHMYENPIAKELGEPRRHIYSNAMKTMDMDNVTHFITTYTRPWWHYLLPWNWGKPSTETIDHNVSD